MMISFFKKTWFLFSVIFLSFMVSYLLTRGFWKSLGISSVSILLWIIGGTIWRMMADRAIIWFRVAFMNAAIFLKDRGVDKVIVVCTKSKEEQILRVVPKEEKELYRFSRVGKPFFIGFPWSGYALHSWYVSSRDNDDPNTSPRFKVSLAEMTWDYVPPKDEEGRRHFIETWSVDTADPVQVFPEISLYAEIIDVIKAIFHVEHYEEAIQKEIATAWKISVATLEYIKYELGKKDNEGKEITGVGDLQTEAQKNLNLFFFGQETPPREMMITDQNPNGEKIISLKEGTPARRVLDSFGVWIKQVLIRNIDPTDPVIREKLQEKMKAQAEAAASLEKAKGERDSTKAKADGEEYEKIKVGSAEAKVVLMKLSAQASGLEAIAKKLGLKEQEKSLLFLAHMVEKMMATSNHSLVIGNPGDLGQSILAAANMMTNGMQKVTNGQSEEGMQEIKEGFSALGKEDKKKLIQTTLTSSPDEGKDKK